MKTSKNHCFFTNKPCLWDSILHFSLSLTITRITITLSYKDVLLTALTPCGKPFLSSLLALYMQPFGK